MSVTEERKLSGEVFSELPVMPVLDPPTWRGLQIEGLVESSLSMNLSELVRMSDAKIEKDFYCFDGWVAPAQQWEGVSVTTLLNRAGIMSGATGVEFISGGFNQPLTLKEALAPDVIVALRLNGKKLPGGNGGPCRLLAGSKDGPTHVKWLQHIKVVG
jgi:DMSO/TMAO reductase YedYZ molybdopterin-dependent catalytic subunit